MDKIIEQDIQRALENASLEDVSRYMEDIDVSSFEFPNEISKQKMKSRTLNLLGIEDKKEKGANKTKLRKNLLKGAVGMVASLAIILVSFCTFSVEAREMVKQLFSFIPGIGVTQSYEDIYVLSKSTVCSENDNLLMEINQAVVEDGYITVEYKATLKKVDIDRVNYFVLEENPILALNNYYKDLGYDQYFQLNDKLTMPAYSSLKIKGEELDRVETETFFNELSGYKYALITEKYDMKEYTVSDVRDAILTLGTLDVVFSLEKAKVFESKEQALEDKLVCEKDGITLVCETKWIDQTLVASFYYENPDDKEVVTLFPYYLSEDAGVFLNINGKRVVGNVAINEVNSNSVVFWLDQEKEKQPCEITIPVIAVKDVGTSDDDAYILESNFTFEIKE